METSIKKQKTSTDSRNNGAEKYNNYNFLNVLERFKDI